MARLTGCQTSVLVMLSVFVSVLTGCAGAPPVKEEAVATPLSPMARPDRAVGYKVVFLEDGKKELVGTLAEKTADTETWTYSDGCRAVVSRTGFAPTVEWANCDGESGTHAVKLLSGTPYPLGPGSKWAYSFSGSNSRGDRWEGQRDCEVKGTARVKTGIGDHDTFKVLCEDRTRSSKTTRTFYVSPARQTSVVWDRHRVRYWQGAPPPDKTQWELVRQD